MPSRSAKPKTDAQNAADFGFARTRDLAFDAVQRLWRRRRDEGMKQIDIAKAIDRQPAWVNRSLRGPGNWTLRTLGELVQGLNGELEITVHGLEDAPTVRGNYHAYADYEPSAVVVRVVQASPVPTITATSASENQADLFRRLGITSAPAAAVTHD